MNDLTKKSFPTAHFLAMFFPVALVAIAIAFTLGQRSNEKLFEDVSNIERRNLLQINGFTTKEVSYAILQLDALTREPLVKWAIDSPTTGAIQALQTSLMMLVNLHPNYHHVRWIDAFGNVKVHVTNSQNGAFTDNKQNLKNVSDQPFFTNTTALSSGEIYISHAGSTQENYGENENRIHPILRISTPVHNIREQSRGILVIDVATPYIDEAMRIASHSNPDTDYLVIAHNNTLNQATPVAQAKTNFKKYTQFDVDYPGAWQHITSNRSGSIRLKNGIWSWQTMVPDNLISRMAKVSSNNIFNVTRIHSDGLTLKFVAHKSAHVIANLPRNFTIPIIVGTVLLLSIYFWSLIFMLRSQEREKNAAVDAANAKAQAQHLQHLKELDARFQLSVDASSIGMLVVDAKGSIILSNTAAELMLGYDKEALHALNVDDLLPLDRRGAHTKFRTDFFNDPENRKMGWGRNLEAVTADGKRILVEVGLNPYKDRGEQVVLASIIERHKAVTGE